MAVTLHQTDGAGPIESTSIPPENAFHVVLQRRDMPAHDLWLGSQHIRVGGYERNSVSVLDLSRSPRTRIATAHQALVFYQPTDGLAEIAEEFGVDRIEGLAAEPGKGVIDPVMARVGAALFPMLCRSEAADTLALESWLLTAQAHIARAYGRPRQDILPSNGRLAAWQEDRAKELMQASLSEGLPLAELAKAASLSVSRFAHGFRHSTGMAPHQWLAKRRIERAKAMLLEGRAGITDIALATGYSEQSSFSRAFRRATGLSPARWARQHGRLWTPPHSS